MRHAIALATAIALASGAAALGFGVRAADAAGTSPNLLLASADAFPTAGGGRLVQAAGSFNFDDIIQVAFPAAGLMVVQGQRFVRYEVTGKVFSATSAAVSDGVAPEELTELLGQTTPASAPARVAHLDRDGVAIVLPPELVAGPATVLLYAAHENELFVSNAIEVSLP